MSKPAKHAPKHRAPSSRTVAVEAPKKVVRTTLVLSTVAMATTGAAVAGGVFSSSPVNAGAQVGATLGTGSTGEGSVTASAPTEAAETTAAAAGRAPALSRSQDRRSTADQTKVAALSGEVGGALTRSEDASDDDPREVARALLGEFGFSSSQFGCLDSLWTRESNWRVNADNPTSSAYGIPQALPGSKMSSEGADWATNPVTQIRWGLGYIQDRYGSPCGAWAHSEARGWY